MRNAYDKRHAAATSKHVAGIAAFETAAAQLEAAADEFGQLEREIEAQRAELAVKSSNAARAGADALAVARKIRQLIQ